MIDLRTLPGADLVLRGLEDARAGRPTAEGALVQIAAGRLRERRIVVPVHVGDRDAELDLYERLAYVEPEGDVYSTYSAWLESLDAFLDALDHRRP